MTSFINLHTVSQKQLIHVNTFAHHWICKFAEKPVINIPDCLLSKQVP